MQQHLALLERFNATADSAAQTCLLLQLALLQLLVLPTAAAASHIMLGCSIWQYYFPAVLDAADPRVFPAAGAAQKVPAVAAAGVAGTAGTTCCSNSQRCNKMWLQQQLLMDSSAGATAGPAVCIQDAAVAELNAGECYCRSSWRCWIHRLSLREQLATLGAAECICCIGSRRCWTCWSLVLLTMTGRLVLAAAAAAEAAICSGQSWNGAAAVAAPAAELSPRDIFFGSRGM